ncbi:hypothetical protein WOLCODRAFT_154943 [Wolfiporia cocos MD-104 SS10]|uniref:Uncharacterized protein n=1 Tax=Wolfiporia cocos (strain MD-104) TaxID=742152 RepID=A0A2H3JRY5_WOLCO|nr:hypothetical protein WOLCODRAFT_154943 [Wolfiporia cocos MD-104 SS10]
MCYDSDLASAKSGPSASITPRPQLQPQRRAISCECGEADRRAAAGSRQSERARTRTWQRGLLVALLLLQTTQKPTAKPGRVARLLHTAAAFPTAVACTAAGHAWR